LKKCLLVLGIFLIFVFFNPVSGQEGTSLSQFEKPFDMVGLKVLALSVLEFKPIKSTEYQTYDWELNQYGLTVPNGNPESLTLLAQFHLPDGVEIKKVAALYYDNSAAASIDIAMGYVAPLDLSEPGHTVFFTSEGLPEANGLRAFKTTTIIDPIIDNTNVYFAMIEFDADTMGDVAFRGLWIAYQ
jgi:hypothetical protein